VPIRIPKVQNFSPLKSDYLENGKSQRYISSFYFFTLCMHIFVILAELPEQSVMMMMMMMMMMTGCCSGSSDVQDVLAV